jgi:hypothetical protein
MKHTAYKENDWHGLGACQVQFGDHMICHSALKVCGVQCQVLDHQLTRPKVESEMEENEEDESRSRRRGRRVGSSKW